MPIFDFKCSKCEKVEEHYVKTGDETVICIPCKNVMDKLFSGEIAFQFKGFGFPTNDAKLFKTPPDAAEKLEQAGLKKKNNMDVTD